MNRITDGRLVQVRETRACEELPADIVDGAYRLVRRLLAARSFSDVDVFTRLLKMPAGRYAAPISGKWAIDFAWCEPFGAYDLRLLRLGKRNVSGNQI